MIDKFMQYLNDGDLIEEVVAANGKDTYLMPTRRNAGTYRHRRDPRNRGSHSIPQCRRGDHGH